MDRIFVKKAETILEQKLHLDKSKSRNNNTVQMNATEILKLSTKLY